MAKVLEFQLQFSPSNEHPGLISFRMDWLDLLVVQGTLKSLLQHHTSKVSILWRSAFFTVQLSHPYMTTGKAIALTRWTFVGKVMSLLLNMLSRLEKTLESPLDCKEIKLIHSKGDQSWVFIGRTELKLKLQYFGHLMRRVESLEKTLMLGGIGGRRRRGRQRMRWPKYWSFSFSSVLPMNTQD